MEHFAGKIHFLKHEYTKKLADLDINAERRWGKMNVLQMIEHMTEYVRIGSGKNIHKLVTPEEHLPRYQEFLASDKPFWENTPNALLSDTPPQPKHSTKEAAIAELQSELDDFFRAFENESGKKVLTPFFGELDYELSVQLQYKHAVHHLKQFGVE